MANRRRDRRNPPVRSSCGTGLTAPARAWFALVWTTTLHPRTATRIASIYDEWHPIAGDAEQAAEVLAGLAGDGPALKLAIGTGRVAIPLAARGVSVHGIDASAAMVVKLRQKPGGADIPVELGNFVDARFGWTAAGTIRRCRGWMRRTS